MLIQDNILKEYLKNVYFVTGTACGGKSTISRALGREFGFEVFNIDDRFEEHRAKSDPLIQVNMNKNFANADEFFLRPVEEYTKWLLDNAREQLDFIILDLIRISQDRPVICDSHITAEEADVLTVPERTVFLIKEPTDISELISDYSGRPDHTDFRDYLNSATDAEKARYNCGKVLYELNRDACKKIKASRYRWIERTADSTVEKTMKMVADHFGFKK
ncbi:MAG: shikimate kinase [Ruminiclostridium sp.]|nr:shikimate kinase [Ruminiclostridium sp.]